MGNGRGDCAMVVYPALTWETDASRRLATRAEARMNNHRNTLTALTVDSSWPAGCRRSAALLAQISF